MVRPCPGRSFVVGVELGCFVVLALAGPTLDLFFLGEQPLEFGVRLLDERCRLLGDDLGARLDGYLDGLLAATATATGAHHASTGRVLATGGLADRHGGFPGDLVLGGRLVRKDLALVDPDLDADAPEGGSGFGAAVVDVGSQRVEGHPPFSVPLLAGHLGAAQAAAALHANALGAGLHRGLDGAFHRPAERDSTGELVGDALGDQGRVELGLLDLLDVELDLGVAGDLVEALAQAVRFGAAAADDDSWTRGVDVDPQPVSGAFDLD